MMTSKDQCLFDHRSTVLAQESEPAADEFFANLGLPTIYLLFQTDIRESMFELYRGSSFDPLVEYAYTKRSRHKFDLGGYFFKDHQPTMTMKRRAGNAW